MCRVKAVRALCQPRNAEAVQLVVGAVQANSLQGPFQSTDANLTVFAPINDAFNRRAFVKPFYSCTNVTCLLNNNPEVSCELPS